MLPIFWPNQSFPKCVFFLIFCLLGRNFKANATTATPLYSWQIQEQQQDLFLSPSYTENFLKNLSSKENLLASFSNCHFWHMLFLKKSEEKILLENRKFPQQIFSAVSKDLSPLWPLNCPFFPENTSRIKELLKTPPPKNLSQKAYAIPLCNAFEKKTLPLPFSKEEQEWEKACFFLENPEKESLWNRPSPWDLLEEEQRFFWCSHTVSSLCLRQLKVEDESCLSKTFSESLGKEALTCAQLGARLVSHRLPSLSLFSPQECPSKINNSTLISISRLLRILKKSSSVKKHSCFEENLTPYFSLFTNPKVSSSFSQKICFKNNKEKEKNSCVSYFPGNGEGKFFESERIREFLTSEKKISTGTPCRVYFFKEWPNPISLEYKNGCIALKQHDFIFSEAKILVNNTEIDSLFYESSFSTDFLLPLKISEETNSLKFLLEKFHSITFLEIESFSELQKFFEGENKNKLVLAQGCSEDFFQNQNIFQLPTHSSCWPVSILITKASSLQEIYFLSPFSSVQYPQILTWANLLKGVVRFKNLHPQKYHALWGVL